MLLQYLGHSFFVLELADGRKIAMDPYGELYCYPARKIQADFCCVSHQHGDHAGTQCLEEGCRILSQEGKNTLGGGLTITGVSTWHDTSRGASRGNNLFYIIEAEGLRVGHAGDLGHVLSLEQLKKIGKLDILLLPVGGFYTASMEDTLENKRLLRSTVTIPMHYRTEYNPEMPIAPLADFLKSTGAKDTQLPILRVTKQDISERPEILTMRMMP